MARKPRLDYPGCWHHLMHRGARREPIFREDSHRRLFLRCLSEACERTGLEVHAYCLMTNHYHLLAYSPHGQAYRAMKHLNGTYSLRLNRRYGWDGPLFRDRYTNVIVDSDEYLKQLVAYIHLNPVKAMLCARPEDHPWSSYRAYVEAAPKPSWLTMNQVRAYFPTAEGLVTFTREVLEGAVSEAESSFDFERGTLVSLSHHAEALSTKVHRDRIPPEAVVDAVVAATGQPLEILVKAIWGRGGNPGRRMLAWALVEYSGLTHREVASILETRTNAVSCLLKRTLDNDEAEAQRRIRGWRAALDGILGK